MNHINIDKDAEITYREFFKKDELNYGDLMKINPDDLPNFDFMIGGFPCQTFSIVGTRRRGRHGILYVRNGQFRKLSGYEALLLKKFPKKYADKVRGKISNQKLLQQAGNAMTSSVIEEIAKNLITK